MSLLNKASLIQIPSGYKDGTLYSAKPTNGDGDFTFSRGSNLAATRVKDGLIEKGRENLLTYSNDFSNWVNTSSSETSGQSGYDGSSDAWQLDKSAANGRIGIAVSGSSVGTMSIYAKAGTKNWVKLSNASTGQVYAFFNLSTGQLGSTGTDIIDSNITSIGNSWYRCSMTFNASYGAFNIWVSENDNDTSGTSGNIYIQDAQLEAGLVATDYIETTTTTEQAGILEDMPRLDYSGGATCGSLLLEPQRSNVITQSEYIGAWTESGLTITDNNATSPEGVSNAAKLTLPSGSATKRIALGSMPVTAVARSYSFFVKSDDITAVQLVHSGDLQGYARFDISTGVVGSTGTKTTSDIQDYGNGWYRCIANFDSSNAFGSTIYLYINDSATGSYGGSTSAEGDLFVYGAQYEEGSYPTSYIPTYGSSVTRSADNIPLLDLRSDGLLTGTDYTYVVNLIFNTGTATFSGFLNEVDSIGGYKGGLVWNGGLQYRTPVSGSNQYVTLDSVISKGDFSKLVIRCTGSLREFFYNGTKLGTSLNSDNAGTDTDGFRFYYNSATANFFSPSYSQINVFPTALTDAECEQLTTI